MYQHHSLTPQRKFFFTFLILSLITHGAVLLYKRSGRNFSVSSQNQPSAITVKINLQQNSSLPKPRPIVKKIVKKPKPIKRKTLLKKEELKQEKIKEPTQQASGGPKAFDSMIKNYRQPHYPRIALRRGITGVVKLSLWIKGNGQIEKVIVLESSGHEALDNSALTAAKSWTFKAFDPSSDRSFRLEKRVVYKIN